MKEYIKKFTDTSYVNNYLVEPPFIATIQNTNQNIAANQVKVLYTNNSVVETYAAAKLIGNGTTLRMITMGMLPSLAEAVLLYPEHIMIWYDEYNPTLQHIGLQMPATLYVHIIDENNNETIVETEMDLLYPALYYTKPDGTEFPDLYVWFELVFEDGFKVMSNKVSTNVMNR